MLILLIAVMDIESFCRYLELENDLLEIIEPSTFFQGWSDAEFLKWIYLDEYGLVCDEPQQVELAAQILIQGDQYRFYDLLMSVVG